MKRILALLAVYFLLVGQAFAAITVGTAASVNGTSSGGSNTITLACNAGTGSNRVMFAAVGYGGSIITDVNYAGVSMGEPIAEEIDAATSTIILQLYKPVNPASGTNNLVLDFLGGDGVPAFLACVPMDGVDQTTPNDTAVVGDSSGSPHEHVYIIGYRRYGA